MLKDQLFAEIAQARTRVYRVGAPTPLQEIAIPEIDARIFIKREDLSPINAYKWRGAFNCTAVLQQQGATTVVAASAGNHAQGVALAARTLGMQAKIFMPLPTPLMKQTAVKLHGGDHVEVILAGDNFDQVSAEAHAYCEKHGYHYVHAFDDIHTIAGQATMATEITESNAPFDYAFLQIGGGGLAAGVGTVLKAHHGATEIIGVEGVGQASMLASFAAGAPVTLDDIDTFCDGTAVKRPGDLTYQLCRDALSAIRTVTNEEVCAAIQQLWETCRTIPEPSGAMGLAGLIQFATEHPEKIRGKRLLAVVCGANMDFGKLALISSQSAVGSHRRRYVQLHISEAHGSLLTMLDKHFADVNVSEFQYGKVSETDGWPVIAFEATPARIEHLFDELRAKNVPFRDVTGDADVRYRIIPYHADLFKRPLFLHVHFPERRGALRDFMRRISPVSNLCYFNYAYTGESIGRALMGFEFESAADREKFLGLLDHSVVTCKLVDADVAARMLGQEKVTVQ